jgi:hypothetical protein
MSTKSTIDKLININASNLTVSNSFSISPFLHTFKDIVAGSFTISTVVSPGGVADGQTQTINNVAGNPNLVILTIGTPSGTHNWDRVIITQSVALSSYNSTTNVYTLGYNLFNVNGSATASTATIYYLLCS